MIANTTDFTFCEGVIVPCIKKGHKAPLFIVALSCLVLWDFGGSFDDPELLFFEEKKRLEDICF